MTEEICQFALTTVLRTESSGRLTSCPLTTITTSPSSLRESVRSKTHIGSFLCKECLTCLKRVVQRSFQSSLNWSFQSRVSYSFKLSSSVLFQNLVMFNWIFVSRFEHSRCWDCLHHSQDPPVTRHMLWHHWRSLGAILPSDPSSAEPNEDKERQHGRQDRLQPEERLELGRTYPVDAWTIRIAWRWGCIH